MFLNASLPRRGRAQVQAAIQLALGFRHSPEREKDSWLAESWFEYSPNPRRDVSRFLHSHPPAPSLRLKERVRRSESYIAAAIRPRNRGNVTLPSLVKRGKYDPAPALLHLVPSCDKVFQGTLLPDLSHPIQRQWPMPKQCLRG